VSKVGLELERTLQYICEPEEEDWTGGLFQPREMR
jgi:hypothetical protein